MEVLFSSWVEKEKRASKAKKRRYPHFDPKISFNRNISFFKSYFSKKDNVAEHSFYPFIRMVVETPRFKKTDKLDENGKAIRKITLKPRPLAYAAHFDEFIYSYYSTLLTERYEKKIKKWGFYENVSAYLEKGESNIEFAHEIFEYIKSKDECVALAFDVSSFFDGLDHEHLKKMWGRVINKYKLPEDHFQVYKSLTNYTYIDKADLEREFPFLVSNPKMGIPTHKICEPAEFRDRLRKKGLINQNPFKNTLKGSSRFGEKCGIPQGSPISACLSNIYMIEFDIRAKQEVASLKGIYRRYCDDIIVVVEPKHAPQVKKFILEEIKRYHLEINDSKTEVTYFKKNSKEELRAYNDKDGYQNLQYLGFEFNGKNTYIRSSSMSRYFKRMTARIRENLKAAYGNKAIGDHVFKKKLHNRYTEKGERNFITYAQRAADYMQSDTIKKQYKNSIKKVKEKFSKKKADLESKRNPKKIMK
ncbi:MAG TPA: antiviral reverse transcriptase Drt2 [Pedobacter sp.]